MTKIDKNDGKTVINIYSRGITEVGRLLSNFSLSNISMPEGQFSSIESYWYYLCINPCLEKEKIKDKIGNEAKEYGEYLISQYGHFTNDEKEFQNKIIAAMTLKVKSNERLKKLLNESSLPFDHYYFYNGKKVGLKQYKWFVEAYEVIRIQVKSGLL